jgi:hypothetical protein
MKTENYYILLVSRGIPEGLFGPYNNFESAVVEFLKSNHYDDQEDCITCIRAYPNEAGEPCAEELSISAGFVDDTLDKMDLASTRS